MPMFWFNLNETKDNYLKSNYKKNTYGSWHHAQYAWIAHVDNSYILLSKTNKSKSYSSLDRREGDMKKWKCVCMYVCRRSKVIMIRIIDHNNDSSTQVYRSFLTLTLIFQLGYSSGWVWVGRWVGGGVKDKPTNTKTNQPTLTTPTPTPTHPPSDSILIFRKRCCQDNKKY
jgi:hypothetical protein